MTAQRFTWPLVQWMDQNGDPLTGGLLNFYQTGTSSRLATYADAGLTIPNDNPVAAGSTPGAYSNGVFPNIFLQDAVYKVVLTDRFGVEIWSADPVSPVIDTSPTLASYYDLPVYIEGKPSNSEVYPIFNCVRAVQLPASLTNSIVTVTTLPTATTTFTLYKNASSIGTIAFATDGSATVSFPLAISFSAGDQFSMVNQAVADSTAANIAMTFVFTIL